MCGSITKYYCRFYWILPAGGYISSVARKPKETLTNRISLDFVAMETCCLLLVLHDIINSTASCQSK